MATVLCVDDAPDNLLLLTVLLEDAGHSVQVASDGPDALASVENDCPDIVLLDVLMPGMSGLEVLAAIRATRNMTELPVLMVTALSAEDDIVRALELGANDYLVKPIQPEVMLARLETHLRVRGLSAEHAALSRMRDEFLSIASHDLRQPLTLILGFAELLAEDLPPGATVTDEDIENFRLIEEAARSMLHLVTDFFEAQTLSGGGVELHREPVALSRLVSDAVARMRGVAEAKNIELVLESGAEHSSILAHPARLAQVIDNFVSNAIKFCEPRSRVVVRTGVRNHLVRLEVEDDGPGLNEQDLARVFQKFAKLSNRPTSGEPSSGLGLYISRLLVEAHGGEVGVANNPDQGATFWFSVPAAGGSQSG